MYVCPATGHATDPEHLDGPNCAKHGVPFFTHCPTCGEPWPLHAKHAPWGDPDWGENFCAACTAPAPWLSRGELLEWIRNQVRAEGMRGAISRSTALDLAEMVQHMESKSADDTKTIEAWKRLRDTAPKVWEALKPVVNTVIGEAVKRALGL
jgi:hypothetical protein